MLFLDGANSLEGQWYDLDELQGTTRSVRVTNLDRRNP